MENEGNPVLKFIAGIVLVLVIIGCIAGIVIFAVSKANTLTDDVNEQMDKIMETKYTQYDGEVISGSNLLNVIKTSYSDTEPIFIQVKTLSNTSGVYYVCDSTATPLDEATERNLIKAAKTKSDNNYIAPTGKFYGEVQRNKNGGIIGIVFTQQ